jgi:hypothetical protein
MLSSADSLTAVGTLIVIVAAAHVTAKLVRGFRRWRFSKFS